jgi:hypothetical protein
MTGLSGFRTGFRTGLSGFPNRFERFYNRFLARLSGWQASFFFSFELLGSYRVATRIRCANPIPYLAGAFCSCQGAPTRYLLLLAARAYLVDFLAPPAPASAGYLRPRLFSGYVHPCPRHPCPRVFSHPCSPTYWGILGRAHCAGPADRAGALVAPYPRPLVGRGPHGFRYQYQHGGLLSRLLWATHGPYGPLIPLRASLIWPLCLRHRTATLRGYPAAKQQLASCRPF